MPALTPDQRFEQLNLTLPPAPTPLGVYKPLLVVGNFVYVSGHGTVKEDKSLIIGRIGDDMTMEEGKLAARQVGLAILATFLWELPLFWMTAKIRQERDDRKKHLISTLRPHQL